VPGGEPLTKILAKPYFNPIGTFFLTALGIYSYPGIFYARM
jgi:hypothetical protein